MFSFNKMKIKITLAALMPCALAAVLAVSADETISNAWDFNDELPVSSMDQFAKEFSSHLPIIIVETDVSSGALANRYSPPLAVIWCFDNGEENRLTDTPTEVINFAKARYRGTTSMGFPKTPLKLFTYSPNLTDPLGYPLLDMASASEWVLHPPYADRSLLRNWFSYDLAATVLYWQPIGKPVQLFMRDGESGPLFYRGVYLLCESVSTGETRLDIGQFNLRSSETVDHNGGGYVFQIDREHNNYFVLPNGLAVRYSYPTPQNMYATQITALQNEVEFYVDLLTKTGRFEGVSGVDLDYEYYLDVDSFIDYFLVAELVQSDDTGLRSTYMYRPLGGKLVMGPLWDCDLSMGNNYYWQPDSYSFLNIRALVIKSFFEDESIRLRFVNRWFELRDSIWTDAELLRLFDEMAEYLVQPAAQNAECWPEIYDEEIEAWPTHDPNITSWGEEIEQTRCWLVNRVQWLDENIPRLIYETAEEIGIGNAEQTSRFD